MSDDPNAAGNQPGGEGNTPPVDDKRTALAGDTPADGGAPQDTGAGDPPAALPDNWRDLMAGGDEKLAKRLSRYTSSENIAKALVETQDKLRAGQTLPTLPDDATEEEISAFRKQVGVPEKPEDYGFAFPEHACASEDDNGVFWAFAKHLHDRHISKNDPGAKAAFEFYLNRMNEARAQRAEFEGKATLESMAELRAEFPPNELKRNNKIADEFLMKHFGEDQQTLDAINMVLDTRLPNGVKVMHYAPFMKGLFAMARSYADDEALLSGDAAGGGKSIDEEFNDLIKESVANSKEFNRDKAKVARLNELAAAKERRSARAA